MQKLSKNFKTLLLKFIKYYRENISMDIEASDFTQNYIKSIVL